MRKWRTGENFKKATAMKKISKSLFVSAAVALALVSCQKDPGTVVFETSENTVNFTARAVDTKTAFGTPDGTTYPTLWTSNDSNIKVALNYASQKDAAVTPSADFTTATFDASFTDDGSGAYTFLALSPSTAVVSLSASYASWNVTIPTLQVPLDNSVDESAQILAAISEKYTAFPNSVMLDFTHVTAYGKLSFVNLALAEGEAVESVSMTAEEGWAGRWYYYPETGTVSASSASATIALTTSKTEDIWFACAPVDLGGKTVKVTVATDQGNTYVKTITIPEGKQFEAGKIASFRVNMEGIIPTSPDIYTLVTDAADLTVGSEVIIVATASDLAISTTQNSNNRASAAVTKSTDPQGNSIIALSNDAVQVFSLENGVSEGTLAFSTGSGYIYAASSSSNYLRTEADLDANGSWTVSVTDAGVATVKATGANTRNWLRYNSGSNLFSCYASGQQDISIYKKNG